MVLLRFFSYFANFANEFFKNENCWFNVFNCIAIRFLFFGVLVLYNELIVFPIFFFNWFLANFFLTGYFFSFIGRFSRHQFNANVIALTETTLGVLLIAQKILQVFAKSGDENKFLPFFGF